MDRNQLLSFAIVVLLAACASTPERPTPTEGWLSPSPRLHEEIQDQITRLPWTHGIERVETIQWLATVGEPAYASLLELCMDPRPDVAASAVAALGATGDSRLVNALRGLDWPPSDDAALEYEKARTYLRLGDWSAIDTLVGGLEEDSEWARGWCLSALREATRIDFGYDPTGPEPERTAAVARWREWIASRRTEGILAQGRD